MLYVCVHFSIAKNPVCLSITLAIINTGMSVCVRSTFSTSHHQELQERGCAVPVWLDGGSVEESLDKDCVYVLESFDCDCYSVLHGKYR